MPADHAYPDRDEAWFVTGRVDVDRLQSPDLAALGIDHSVAQPVPEIFCGEHGIRLTPPLRTQTSLSSACSPAKRCILTTGGFERSYFKILNDLGGPRTYCGTDLQDDQRHFQLPSLVWLLRTVELLIFHRPSSASSP